VNLTLPNPKVGFTSIEGQTNDMNGMPIRATCGCAVSDEMIGACMCPTDIKPLETMLPTDRIINNNAYGVKGRRLPPVTVAPISTGITTSVVDTTTNAITGIWDKIKQLYATNPTYFYIGGAALLVLNSKKLKRILK
jgi:hypothetical protein